MLVRSRKRRIQTVCCSGHGGPQASANCATVRNFPPPFMAGLVKGVTRLCQQGESQGFCRKLRLRAVHAAAGTIPIVWVGGDPIEAGFAASFARPGGKITGVDVYAGNEIWGKLLQILKEAVPSASKVAFLAMAGTLGSQLQVLQEAGQRLQTSLILMQIEDSTPSEYQR